MVYHRQPHRHVQQETGLRLFVAIELNDAARTRLQEVQQQLAEHCRGVRWTPLEQLHLTVKFLGAVEETRLDRLKTTMISTAASVPGFTLKIGGSGCLPHRGVVRILYAGAVDITGKLQRCVQAVETALDQIGYLRDDKPFLSHITIGRAKDFDEAEKIRAAVAELSYSAVALNVEFLTLMSSNLLPDGATYDTVIRAPLGHG